MDHGTCIRRYAALGKISCVAALAACASIPPPDHVTKELGTRAPTQVELGATIPLMDASFDRIASVTATDGQLHLAAVERSGALHHVELRGSTVIAHSDFGVSVHVASDAALDIAEWPVGTIRILAGDRQFLRSPESDWRSLDGNRCQRFLRVSDRLFCAYVAGRGEVDAPRRTDVYAGLLFIVPFYIPLDTAARKLVIAELSSTDWVIRAVVDPSSPQDVDADFSAGLDSAGNLHFLYKARSGGGIILLGPMGGGAGEFPGSTLRYARLDRNAIGRLGRDAQPLHAAVTGSYLGFPPYIFNASTGDAPWGLVGPLGRNFAVDPRTGAFEGIVDAFGAVLDDGGKVFDFGPVTRMRLDIRSEDARWQWPAALVFVDGWPERNVSYSRIAMRFDAGGSLHVLANVGYDCFLSCRATGMSYLVKRDGSWSRPLPVSNVTVDAIALAGSGERLMAVWSEPGRGSFGRWIGR